MPPGVAPAYRHAAACPSSWKPADSTAIANTASSRPGLLNASAVADATPLWKSTYQQRTPNAASAGHMTHGRNNTVKGAVIRRVAVGLVTSTFQRSARSGLLRGGAASSVP